MKHFRCGSLLTLLALAACAKPQDPAKNDVKSQVSRKPVVTFATAGASTVEYTVQATGSIEAADEISVPCRVSGVADTVNFEEGDVVTTDTVLAEIEVQKYQLAVDRTSAELARVTAQANLAQTVFSNRQKLYDEGKKLGKDFVTEEQLATYKADVERTKAEVARVNVDLTLAQLDSARSRVRSPIAGVINGKLVSKGEYVKAETVLATILDVSRLRVRFTVPELEASRLKLHQEIQFAIASEPGKWFRAAIFYMNQEADPATRTLECKAEVVDRSDSLRPGLFASVKIVTGKAQSVLIPERAVLPTQRGFVVYVADSIGTGLNVVKARVVRLGLRTAGGVEVTEGLSAGDKYVLDGAAALRDGAEVEEKN